MQSTSLFAGFRNAFEKRPLLFIVLLAFIVRLMAVLFAKGYMMHDDHFLTIEPSASWADGKNFNQWLPGIGNNNPHPEPISFFYLGFLFVFFKIFQFFGIENPDMQMYLMRFIHAAYSLLVVIYGFKITELLSNRKNAIQAGLLLAFIAILPNFSVRNLVELVCMPPLMIGFYLLLKHVPFKTFQLKNFSIPQPIEASRIDANKTMLWLLFAAVLMGMAVGIRFQTGLLVALVGFVLLIQHSFLYAFIFGIASFATFFLTQIDDVLLWGGQPFQHLQGYFEYNKKNAANYPGSPTAYLSFISFYILPPVSLFLLAGFVRSWKKYFLIFLPIIGFLLFHILYPNKQERFILPALPFFIILGVIGWNNLVSESKLLQRNARAIRISWIFFWSLNTLAMFVLCFTYSKKSRVESMLYIYHQHDCRNFALEFTHSESGAMMPEFYGNIWTQYYYWNKGDKPADYILNMPHDEEETRNDMQPRLTPNYYLFYDDTNLEQRVAVVQQYFPSLQYQTTIESGWFDKMLHQLNPKNSLEKIHIYKVMDKSELPS
jgi:Alg9-like mannosyltransferase family